MASRTRQIGTLGTPATQSNTSIMQFTSLFTLPKSLVGDHHFSDQRRTFGRVADENIELSRIDLPVAFCFTPVGEGAGVERNRHVLHFARRQTNFLEAFQFLGWTLDFRGRISNIHLRYVRTWALPRVCDIEGHGRLLMARDMCGGDAQVIEEES